MCAPLQLVKEEYSDPWIMFHRQKLVFKERPKVVGDEQDGATVEVSGEQCINLTIANAEQGEPSLEWDVSGNQHCILHSFHFK